MLPSSPKMLMINIRSHPVVENCGLLYKGMLMIELMISILSAYFFGYQRILTLTELYSRQNAACWLVYLFKIDTTLSAISIDIAHISIAIFTDIELLPSPTNKHSFRVLEEDGRSTQRKTGGPEPDLSPLNIHLLCLRVEILECPFLWNLFIKSECLHFGHILIVFFAVRCGAGKITFETFNRSPK